MEQGTKSASSGPSDFPPRKLVRQLDFTPANCGNPAPAPPVLPVAFEHSPSPLQQQQNQMPRPSILPTSMKSESPQTRSKPLFEMKEATPTRKKNCNCKHSRCLKLLSKNCVVVWHGAAYVSAVVICGLWS